MKSTDYEVHNALLSIPLHLPFYVY